MKIKFLWFWSILATLTVFALVYFLQAEQDGIARLHLGAGLRININSQPSDTLKIKNVKTYPLNPARPDSAKIIVWQYIGTLGAGESVVDTLQF